MKYWKRSKRFGNLLFSVLFTLAAIGPGSARALEASGMRAVSLKALQAKAVATRNKIPDVVATLAGLNEVLGYVADDANQDIVLYGTISSTKTNALYAEDLCIALRNDWMKFATVHGNTYEYTDLGCTIDPEPQTWDKLSGVSRSISSESDSQRIQQQLNQWTQICQEWQKVKVLGMPFNTRFAGTTVKADYDMKQLVDGNDPLNIPGFESLTSVKLALIRQAVQSGQPISAPLSSMNRFWFYPGKNRYLADDGIVWIRECPVILLTEQEQRDAASKRGFGASGHVDPLAKRFSKDFSALYEKVAEERPVYNELRSLFRFVALAKILHLREMPPKPGLNLDSVFKCGLDISALLEQFPIQEVKVADRVRGRSAIKEFSHESVDGNRRTTYQLWLQSCGGVEMGLEVKPEIFIEPAGSLRRLRKTILGSRPGRDVISWDLSRQDEAVIEMEYASQLAAFNLSPKDSAMLSVHFDGSLYHAYTDTARIYDGDTISGLASALRANGLLDSPQLSVKSIGITAKDLPGFRTALQRQLKKFEPDISLIHAAEETGEGNILNAVASPGLTLDPPSQLSVVPPGKNRPEPTLTVQVRWGGQNMNCKVEFLSPNPESIPPFVQKILDRLSPTGSSSDSMLDLFLEQKRILQKSIGVEKGNIQIRIRTENGTIETGAVFLKEDREAAAA